MIFSKLIPVLASALIASAAHAGPLLLTFVPSAGNGEGRVVLPDDSLITQGSYMLQFNSDDQPPAFLSGYAKATFEMLDLDTNLPTGETIVGEEEFPAWYFIVSFNYLGDNKASGGFGVDNVDRVFSFYPGTYASYSDGNSNILYNYDIAGVWHITPYAVPEPGSLALLLGALGGLAAARRRRAG